jgi:hypothetical protein
MCVPPYKWCLLLLVAAGCCTPMCVHHMRMCVHIKYLSLLGPNQRPADTSWLLSLIFSVLHAAGITVAGKCRGAANQITWNKFRSNGGLIKKPPSDSHIGIYYMERYVYEFQFCFVRVFFPMGHQQSSKTRNVPTCCDHHHRGRAHAVCIWPHPN